MSDETPEAKIARVDETTIGLRDSFKEFRADFKDFLKTNEERHGSHSKRLRTLEDDKTFGKGAVWALGIMWMLLGGVIVKHIVYDTDHPALEASARERSSDARPNGRLGTAR